MIDSVTVNNDNLIVNKGEGYTPPQPPSPSVPSSSQKSSSNEAAAVELSQEVQSNTQTTNEISKSSPKENEMDMEKRLHESVNTLNEKLTKMDREIQFKLDKKINRNYISVIDRKSKEIIREFPPEEIRAFIARFDEINEKLSMSPDLKSMIINLEV